MGNMRNAHTHTSCPECWLCCNQRYRWLSPPFLFAPIGLIRCFFVIYIWVVKELGEIDFSTFAFVSCRVCACPFLWVGEVTNFRARGPIPNSVPVFSLFFFYCKLTSILRGSTDQESAQSCSITFFLFFFQFH